MPGRRVSQGGIPLRVNTVHWGQEPKYLHGLRRVLFKFLNVFLDQDHLLFQKRRLLFQSFHVAQHFGHVLEGLVTRFCSKHAGADTCTEVTIGRLTREQYAQIRQQEETFYQPPRLPSLWKTGASVVEGSWPLPGSCPPEAGG